VWHFQSCLTSLPWSERDLACRHHDFVAFQSAGSETSWTTPHDYTLSLAIPAAAV
jgi:hypothetical protein